MPPHHSPLWRICLSQQSAHLHVSSSQSPENKTSAIKSARAEESISAGVGMSAFLRPLIDLTLSLPIVINVEFPPAASPEILHHTVWRTSCFILLRWKMIILPILATPLHHHTVGITDYSMNLDLKGLTAVSLSSTPSFRWLCTCKLEREHLVKWYFEFRLVTLPSGKWPWPAEVT